MSETRLFRATDCMLMFAGDFFFCVSEHDWYYWLYDRWTPFNWRVSRHHPSDLRPSNPLEFLVATGRQLENQLV